MWRDEIGLEIWLAKFDSKGGHTNTTEKKYSKNFDKNQLMKPD